MALWWNLSLFCYLNDYSFNVYCKIMGNINALITLIRLGSNDSGTTLNLKHYFLTESFFFIRIYHIYIEMYIMYLNLYLRIFMFYHFLSIKGPMAVLICSRPDNYLIAFGNFPGKSWGFPCHLFACTVFPLEVFHSSCDYFVLIHLCIFSICKYITDYREP